MLTHLLFAVDFEGLKVKASCTAISWPDEGFPVRRANINSFGFGGSNGHAIIEQPSKEARSFYTSSYRSEDEEDMFGEEELSEQPYTLVVSANDSRSLKNYIQALLQSSGKPSSQS